MKRTYRILALLALIGASAAAGAALPQDFEQQIEQIIAQHQIPGLAIAVVEDGEVILAAGHGVRELGSRRAVDADTIFPIGSCSKAFTAAALAVLVDDGKIGWDDPIIDHLPAFRMHDAWVTREMTIRDMLVHRSGLGLGAGDLLFVPDTSRSRAELVHSLRYLKPATSFRSGYAYDNVLYSVAGELIEAVSGQRWEDFVHDRLLQPAGMRTATADTAVRLATRNRVSLHARINGKIRGAGDQEVLDERSHLISAAAAPAGGILASARDMARWLQIQLAAGALPGADAGDDTPPRLFSAANAREMWTPQTLIPIRPAPGALADTTPQFNTYALGWTVQDYRGVKVVQHGGAVFGAQALVVLIPSRDAGFAIQINSEDGEVLLALKQQLLDHFLGFEPRDWMAVYDEFKQSRIQAAIKALEQTTTELADSTPSLPLAGYAGHYRDPWYGPMSIRLEDGVLHIDFERTPGMQGTLEHWQYDTFRTRWNRASIEPALVTFALDAEGRIDRIRLQAASPLADFSYDYQDLEFTPASPPSE